MSICAIIMVVGRYSGHTIVKNVSAFNVIFVDNAMKKWPEMLEE